MIDWDEGKKLAKDFFEAAEGDSGDAELSAGWALAEFVEAAAREAGSS